MESWRNVRVLATASVGWLWRTSEREPEGLKTLRNSGSPAAEAVLVTLCPGFMRRTDGLCDAHRSESEKKRKKKTKLLKRSTPFFSSSARTMCPVFSPHSALSKLKKKEVSCNMLCFPTWVLMRRMNIHEGEGDTAARRCCGGCW